ncbi:serine hydrolase domain-containing protein [Crossiella sp. CA198]|uniref:serine hydrolase domain-containing protein n=1 Tax=Crossiella sp. CA198 TaxID=3455607 RepID=UPI003F8D3D29
MRTHPALLATSLALVAGLLTAGAAPAVAADRPEIRQVMQELLTQGAVGVQVRVHDGHGDWAGSAGTTRIGGRTPVRTDARFRAGSITKTFVATVLLQLVDEGRIGLDDPVTRYLPRFGLDQRITVRMVLQHTSGLFSHTGEFRPDGTMDHPIPLEGRKFAANRFRTYTPDDLVRASLTRPPRFEPGADWSYSNTNYVVVGLLIEQVTGTPYATQVNRRIIEPLGLRATSLPGTRALIPGPHAQGYYSYRDGAKVATENATVLNPSWAHAAGEIISTTADLDTFLAALHGGKLLAPHLLAEMRKLVRKGNGGYGLGLAASNPAPGCDVFFGHSGGIHGYNSHLYGNADGSRRIQIAINTAGGDLDSGDVVPPMTEPTAFKAIKAVFCAKA